MSVGAKESIVDKIRKLLRLAKSCNAHEAALAMSRAMEIARKHHLEISEIAAERPKESAVGMGEFRKPKRMSEIQKRALLLTQLFFNVSVLMDPERIVLVGRAEDVCVAEYAWGFLVRACSSALREFEASEASERLGFVRGFFTGVYEALESQRKAEAANALAVMVRSESERDAWISQNLSVRDNPVNVLSNQRKVDRESALVGYVRGRQVRVARAIGAEKAEQLELEVACR